MEVVFAVCRQVEVDDDADVVDVDAARQEVGGDEHARLATAEGLDDGLALVLRHVGVHERHGVVFLVELSGEPVDLSAGVAEDDALRDADGVVEVAQRLELVVLLDRDVVLLDAVKREHLLLDEDAHGRREELLRECENLLRHRRAEERRLDVLWQELEDAVDLLREALAEHLVRLIEHDDLHVTGAQVLPLDDVVDAPGRADRDQHLAALQLRDVVLDLRATDEGVAERHLRRVLLHVRPDALRDFHRLERELSGGREDERLASVLLVVHALQCADDERAGLAGPGLGLGDEVAALNERDDRALLNCGGLLESVRVNTAEELGLEAHVVERRHDLDVLRQGVVIKGIVVLWLAVFCGG